MKLEEIYRLIANEPCALWIGAGFSIDAGYPTANKLKRLLFDKLTKEEQILCYAGSDYNVWLDAVDLKGFSKTFELIKSKPELHSLLFEILTAEPIKTDNHKLLAKIPLFTSIITTNYDKLIESAFNEKDIQVIYSKEEVSKIDPKLTQIYKIHGDIDDPESLILTTDDYSNQYNRKDKNPFWNAIFNEISRSNTIFLCYGYKDENVKADFDEILKNLGNYRRKRFLISPIASELDLKYYHENDITYIEASPDHFLNGLISSIKLNIIKDVKAGAITTDAAMKVLENFNLDSSFKKANGSAELIGIESKDVAVERTIEFSISNKQLMAEMLRFQNSYESLKMNLTAEDLVAFSDQIEGFTLMDLDSLGTLEMQRNSDIAGWAEIEFLKDSLYLNVKYQIYKSLPGQMLFVIEVDDFIISFGVNHDESGKGEMFFKRIVEPDRGSSARIQLRIHTAIMNFLNGDILRLYPQGHPQFEFAVPTLQRDSFFADRIKFIGYLRAIEVEFDITFASIKFDEIKPDVIQSILNVYGLITKGYFADKRPSGLCFNSNNLSLMSTIEALKPGQVIYIVMASQVDYKIFDQEFKLGNIQIGVQNPCLSSNLDYPDLVFLKSPNDFFEVRCERFGLIKENRG
jgi:hypothetical protein